jgi:uncharacterized membrane protein
MRALFHAIVAMSALGALSLLGTTPAAAYSSAPLVICNKSPELLQKVVIGYHSPGVNDPADHSLLTGPFVTRGFWKIAPGECTTFDNPFGARYMFWFIASYHYNGSIDGGGLVPQADPNRWCVPNFYNGGPTPAFTFEDENAKDPSGHSDACWKNGANFWALFHSVDTWVNPELDFTGQ